MSPEAHYYVTIQKLSNARNNNAFIAALCVFALVVEPFRNDPNVIFGVLMLACLAWNGASAYQAQVKIDRLHEQGPPQRERA